MEILIISACVREKINYRSIDFRKIIKDYQVLCNEGEPFAKGVLIQLHVHVTTQVQRIYSYIEKLKKKIAVKKLKILISRNIKVCVIFHTIIAMYLSINFNFVSFY